MLLSNSAVCNSKIPNFIKQQEANGLLSSLGLKTLSSKILAIDNILLNVWTEWNNKWAFISGR